MTRALLIQSHTPKSFWPEAIATSVYLLNRLPTYILNFKTPLDILSTHTNIPSSLSLDPKVFGCTVFVHIPKHDRSKLSPCAVKCVFVGYGINQKGYRCYDPKTRHMYTTMNCDFVESEYFFHQLGSQGKTGERSDSPSGSSPIISTQPSLLPISIPSHVPEPTSPTPSTELDVGLTEEVSSTTESSTESHSQPEVTSDSPTLSLPSSRPEVSTSNDSPVNTTDNLRQDGEIGGEEEIGSNETDDLRVDSDTGQYKLPPKSTRGIPPRRYSPDWRGRKNRYSIANTVTGQLTEMARAFEVALYEDEDVPQSVEGPGGTNTGEKL